MSMGLWTECPHFLIGKIFLFLWSCPFNKNRLQCKITPRYFNLLQQWPWFKVLFDLVCVFSVSSWCLLCDVSGTSSGCLVLPLHLSCIVNCSDKVRQRLYCAVTAVGALWVALCISDTWPVRWGTDEKKHTAAQQLDPFLFKWKSSRNQRGQT